MVHIRSLHLLILRHCDLVHFDHPLPFPSASSAPAKHSPPLCFYVSNLFIENLFIVNQYTICQLMILLPNSNHIIIYLHL